MNLQLDHFSPIQQRMLLLLDDGEMHQMEDLILCLEDTQAGPKNVHTHLGVIRKVLRPWGIDIVPQATNRNVKYRMITIWKPVFSLQVLAPKTSRAATTRT